MPNRSKGVVCSWAWSPESQFSDTPPAASLPWVLPHKCSPASRVKTHPLGPSLSPLTVGAMNDRLTENWGRTMDHFHDATWTRCYEPVSRSFANLNDLIAESAVLCAMCPLWY